MEDLTTRAGRAILVQPTYEYTPSSPICHAFYPKRAPLSGLVLVDQASPSFLFYRLIRRCREHCHGKGRVRAAPQGKRQVSDRPGATGEASGFRPPRCGRRCWAGGDQRPGRLGLCWLVSSSVFESYGQSRGQNPGTQSLCALGSGCLCGVVVAPLSEQMR